MKELIARLEKAEKPERRLDDAIADAIGVRFPEDIAGYPPRYTDSFDSALTLIPDGLYWLASEGKTRPDEPLGAAQVLAPGTNEILGEAEHDSVVIALCIAALRARDAH